jgi:hypothetical protein
VWGDQPERTTLADFCDITSLYVFCGFDYCGRRINRLRLIFAASKEQHNQDAQKYLACMAHRFSE